MELEPPTRAHKVAQLFSAAFPARHLAPRLSHMSAAEKMEANIDACDNLGHVNLPAQPQLREQP
jgi:hypothetical protein